MGRGGSTLPYGVDRMILAPALVLCVFSVTIDRTIKHLCQELERYFFVIAGS
jgi:hypothetical protein